MGLVFFDKRWQRLLQLPKKFSVVNNETFVLNTWKPAVRCRKHRYHSLPNVASNYSLMQIAKPLLGKSLQDFYFRLFSITCVDAPFRIALCKIDKERNILVLSSCRSTRYNRWWKKSSNYVVWFF